MQKLDPKEFKMSYTIQKRPEPEGETTLQKMQRKFTAEPLVPVGAIVTVGFLG